MNSIKLKCSYLDAWSVEKQVMLNAPKRKKVTRFMLMCKSKTTWKSSFRSSYQRKTRKILPLSSLARCLTMIVTMNKREHLETSGCLLIILMISRKQSILA
jgi:hypothetical protein